MSSPHPKANALKTYSFGIFFILFCHANLSAAPVNLQEPDTRLVSYLTLKGTPAGSLELEKIRAQNISATPGNVKLLRETLAGRLSVEERAIIVSILAKLHDRDNSSGQNTDIRSDLKKQVASGDRTVARAAVFAISRAGGDEDLKNVLRDAKTRGQISNDEYAGELARNIRFLPHQRQTEHLELLKKADSNYGIDVLTSELGVKNTLRQYSSESLNEIGVILAKKEPNFQFAIGEFSYVDAMRYTAWLQARSLIIEQQGKTSANDYILSELSNPKLDPRKAIGYLDSPEAAQFVSQAPRAKLIPILDRISAYAESLPQSQIIQEFASGVARKINSLPK